MFSCQSSCLVCFIHFIPYISERVRARPSVLGIGNVTVRVGENATLVCRAFSDALPHFQWIRWFAPYFNVSTNTSNAKFEVIKQKARDPSRHIVGRKQNQKFTFQGVKLTLYNVSSKDEGWYSCIVGNAVGYNFEHAYLRVIVGSGKYLIDVIFNRD